MRVVIDPNVFISAMAGPTSVPGQILDLIDRGKLVPVVSPELAKELVRVSAYPKVRRRVSALRALRVQALLYSWGELRADPPAAGRITRDPTDDYLVRLYRTTKADRLVTGDRDLLEARLSDVHVVTPRQLVEEFTK